MFLCLHQSSSGPNITLWQSQGSTLWWIRGICRWSADSNNRTRDEHNLRKLVSVQGLVERLHSVLRPFLLRRLKSEVEKQMPGKHEHVIKCRLSKRQRTLYEDYMASSDTRDTLASGNYLGIMNVLMSLRKVFLRLTSTAFFLPGITA